jgi:hypothetical protein
MQESSWISSGVTAFGDALQCITTIDLLTPSINLRGVVSIVIGESRVSSGLAGRCEERRQGLFASLPNFSSRRRAQASPG